MAAGLASGCVNHPPIEAIGRCKQCGKPYCGTCQTVGPTGKFCSDACKESHEVFVQRAQQLDSMKKSSSFGAKLFVIAKKVVIFGLAALIIAVILTFFGVTIPVVSDAINGALGR